MIGRKYRGEKGFTISGVWRVNGGDCTEQVIMSKEISEKTFVTDVHLQLSTYQMNEKTENTLGMFNAALKYPNNWEPISLTSLHSSSTL